MKSSQSGLTHCVSNNCQIDFTDRGYNGGDIIFTFSGLAAEQPEERRIAVLRQFQFVVRVSLVGHRELMRRGPEL